MTTPILPDPAAPAHSPAAVHRSPRPLDSLLLLLRARLPGAMAAITHDDELGLIEADDDEARFSVVARDYFPSVSGGELSALPPPDDASCAYLQSRRLVVFDLRQRAHAAWTVAAHREEVAVAGALAALSPRAVVVQIEDTTHYLERDEVAVRLRALDVSQRAARTLGELSLDSDRGEIAWDAARGVVAAARDGGISVYGPDFTPRGEHPLARGAGALLEGSLRRRVAALALHPDRDMAAVAITERERDSGNDYTLYQARWAGRDVAEMTPLAEVRGAGLLRLSGFSPDGSRLVFETSFDGAGRVFVQAIGAAPGAPVLLEPSPAQRVAGWTRGRDALFVVDDELDALSLFRFDDRGGAR